MNRAGGSTDMPIAVLEIDFDEVPQEITGLDRFAGALILLRLKGKPVGQALLPVIRGRVGKENLREALMAAADTGFWEQWLLNHLGVIENRATNGLFPPATVAVCTRDRPNDLRRCLEALMKLPDDGQEFLVIDNCPSTDATRQLVMNYEHVRYVREDLPGLNIARNRALREARNEIVAFSDDDAMPDPNWLRGLLCNFENPLVFCVTGLTMPLELETDPQICFQRLGGFERGFKHIVFDGIHNLPLAGWQVGAGVNMAIRRSAVELVGYFDERLDAGMPTNSGGDSDYFNRILAAGYLIVYSPEALNWHRHRSDWKALRRQVFGYETGGFALLTRNLLVGGEWGAVAQAWDWIWRELGNLIPTLLRREGSTPLSLIFARFCGAIYGPLTLIQAQWRLRRLKRP